MKKIHLLLVFGLGASVQWRYANGNDYQPSDDDARSRCPAAAMK